MSGSPSPSKSATAIARREFALGTNPDHSGSNDCAAAPAVRTHAHAAVQRSIGAPCYTWVPASAAPIVTSTTILTAWAGPAIASGHGLLVQRRTGPPGAPSEAEPKPGEPHGSWAGRQWSFCANAGDGRAGRSHTRIRRRDARPATSTTVVSGRGC